MSATLPRTRPDLQIIPGPLDAGGIPTWTVHDPASDSYHKIGWAERCVLQMLRHRQTVESVCARIRETMPLAIDAKHLQQFIQVGYQNRWWRESLVAKADMLEDMRVKQRPHPINWLLNHYLYFRVPLADPQRFLVNTLPLARVLVSFPLLLLYALCLCLGLAALALYGEQYFNTFPYFFNFEGLLAFGVTMTLVKVVHEFAHAYAAAAQGVRVPSMGAAFIVLWPVAYSDVTDGWRLADRRRRLAVSLAGVLCELVMVGPALLLWALAPPGTLKSVAFLLSSVTLAGTLAVNLNPLMRFDGYYALADAWGIDNLQSRAFALTGWWLRKQFLGWSAPAPESVPTRRLAAMMLYAVCASIYRFFLYLGIAVLVYYAFAKALGMILFLLQIFTFVVRPVVRECRTLYENRRYLSINGRLLLTLVLVGSGLAYLALPLPRARSAPARVEARSRVRLYAPAGGGIRLSGTIRPGMHVEAGQVLASIEVEDVPGLLRLREAEHAEIATQIALLDLDPVMARFAAELRAKEKRLAQICAALRANQTISLVAPIAGELTWWDETLYDNRPVQAGAPVGEILDRSQLVIVARLPGDGAEDLADGATLTFWPATPEAEAVPGRVRSIWFDNAVVQSRRPSWEQPVGRMAFYLRGLVPQPVLRAEVELSEDAALAVGRSGRVYYLSRPRSLLVDGWSWLTRLALRESGF